MGIKYGDEIQLNENVVLNGTTIEWADSVRHLGNLIGATLSDSMDCTYKRSTFIVYVNKLINKFVHLHHKILLNVYKLVLFFL